jgi:hypothetical protein
MFVRPSVRMEQLGSHWTEFHEIWYFLKSVEKIQVSSKSALLEDQYTFSIISHFFVELKMFQTKFVEKLATHIFCSIAFIFENRAVYEIMWGGGYCRAGQA